VFLILHCPAASSSRRRLRIELWLWRCEGENERADRWGQWGSEPAEEKIDRAQADRWTVGRVWLFGPLREGRWAGGSLFCVDTYIWVYILDFFYKSNMYLMNILEYQVGPPLRATTWVNEQQQAAGPSKHLSFHMYQPGVVAETKWWMQKEFPTTVLCGGLTLSEPHICKWMVISISLSKLLNLNSLYLWPNISPKKNKAHVRSASTTMNLVKFSTSHSSTFFCLQYIFQIKIIARIIVTRKWTIYGR